MRVILSLCFVLLITNTGGAGAPPAGRSSQQPSQQNQAHQQQQHQTQPHPTQPHQTQPHAQHQQQQQPTQQQQQFQQQQQPADSGGGSSGARDRAVTQESTAGEKRSAECVPHSFVFRCIVLILVDVWVELITADTCRPVIFVVHTRGSRVDHAARWFTIFFTNCLFCLFVLS